MVCFDDCQNDYYMLVGAACTSTMQFLCVSASVEVQLHHYILEYTSPGNLPFQGITAMLEHPWDLASQRLLLF